MEMRKAISRRDFIKKAGAISGIPLMLPFVSCSVDSNHKLKVLVLGGTNFLGPAIVNSLLARGHQVTLFNRGISNPHLFPELNKINGDREKRSSGYANLQSDQTQWDVSVVRRQSYRAQFGLWP